MYLAGDPLVAYIRNGGELSGRKFISPATPDSTAVVKASSTSNVQVLPNPELMPDAGY